MRRVDDDDDDDDALVLLPLVTTSEGKEDCENAWEEPFAVVLWSFDYLPTPRLPATI